jgi:hypothetical protein
MKKAWFLIVILGAILMTSCYSRTCPTYTKGHLELNKIQVQENISEQPDRANG